MPLARVLNAKNKFSKNARSGGLLPHRSTPHTATKTSRNLQCSVTKANELVPTPDAGVPAQEIKRRSVLFAAPLLFLPVTGCTSGGFYDTGVTENCLKLYQPAAAAEERLKQKLAPGSNKPIKNDQQARLDRFEKGDVLLARQDEARVALEAEKKERARQKVEEMWQSLE